MTIVRHFTLSIAIFGWMLFSIQTAFAQRYLSEFVGTSTLKSSVSSAALSSNLAFETLDNRRLQGGLSLFSSTLNTSDAFALSGTLAQSGNCNVQLQNATTSGGLNLVEIPFDDNSFALIGNANANIASNKLLAAGKYRGTTAIMRAVADPVAMAESSLVLAIASSVTGQRSLQLLEINDVSTLLSFSGRVSQPGILENYNVTITASPKWTYLVGENGSRFLATRVTSFVNAEGNLDGFSGTYALYDASGKKLDNGTIAAD